MDRIINEIIEKLKGEMTVFFSEGKTDIETVEKYFGKRIAEAVLEVTKAYYEKRDLELLKDKPGRKEKGLVVERRGDKRQVLTTLGVLEYQRSYYQKASGGYEYPIDTIAGVTAYERVSKVVGLELVEASCRMSYAKASKYVTGEQVSRQTVMNMIRFANAASVPAERRTVPELHIDADEDHVNLQNGKSTIVPLISVYEGIDHQGKRGACRNVFHISEYGKRPSELWEQVSEEVERRYDLTDTKIYIHGDGATWIQQGVEYFPHCQFVLDRYHKNKAIKQAVGGIVRGSGCQYEYQIRKALAEENLERLFAIKQTLLERYPEREKTIRENMDYLLRNYDSIIIANHDPSARNGGCTEPHVSHVLSERLSSRPMGWSKETLKHFVPILAVGKATFESTTSQEKTVLPLREILRQPEKHYKPHTLGYADPDHTVSFPARRNKVTPLFNALRPF